MQSFMWYEAGMNYTGGSQKCIKGWEMVVWITIGKGVYVFLPENPLIRTTQRDRNSPVVSKGEMCFTGDGRRANVTETTGVDAAPHQHLLPASGKFSCVVAGLGLRH